MSEESNCVRCNKHPKKAGESVCKVCYDSGSGYFDMVGNDLADYFEWPEDEEFGAETDYTLKDWWQQSMDNCICGGNGCLYCEEINKDYDENIALSDLRKISKIVGTDCHCDKTYEDDVLQCYNCQTAMTLEKYGAEDDTSITYATMSDISQDFANFLSSQMITYGMEWSPQEQGWIHQRFENETEYVIWVEKRFNKYIQEMIDDEIFRAEEFGAEETGTTEVVWIKKTTTTRNATSRAYSQSQNRHHTTDTNIYGFFDSLERAIEDAQMMIENYGETDASGNYRVTGISNLRDDANFSGGRGAYFTVNYEREGSASSGFLERTHILISYEPINKLSIGYGLEAEEFGAEGTLTIHNCKKSGCEGKLMFKDYDEYSSAKCNKCGDYSSYDYFDAEEFGAWDANCSVCNGTGWMPKKGDPKKDAKIAKLFGLSIDELTLTPCNAGGKSMGCWSSKNRNRLRRLQRAEEFGATKGMDTYAQPFSEMKIKPTKAKVGILLTTIVAGGLWYAKQMKEE